MGASARTIIARLLVLVTLLVCGWWWGGLAGLLAMGYVACFVQFGLASVMASEWWSSLWATMRWFVYFLLLHFVVYCFDERLSDGMLSLLASAVDSVAACFRDLTLEYLIGFIIGIAICIGVVWLMRSE